MFPKMMNNPQLSDPIVKPDTFQFKCHVNFDPTRTDVGFDVEWLFDNKTDTHVARTHVTGSARDVVIDQSALAGHMGETVSMLGMIHSMSTITAINLIAIKYIICMSFTVNVAPQCFT